MEWKFQQVFGDATQEKTLEADIISSVEFSRNGDYLAIGDKGGRVVILKRNKSKKRKVEFQVMTEFQSHEPEFDYLKSLEIEEKINQIRWLPDTPTGHQLLTTNDKTIKLWKVYGKTEKKLSNLNFNGNNPLSSSFSKYSTSSISTSKYSSTSTTSTTSDIKIPKVVFGKKVIAHTPKNIYSNAHAYHINSISLNSDGETFLSADDLRINLWNLQHTKQSLQIVDIKPTNMEDLTEVITSASFHPINCNLFMYSSSKGSIVVGDLRKSSIMKGNNYAKSFQVTEDPNSKTFFSEIIASISDTNFSPDGKYIVSRDYMTLKIWDMKMENKPVKVFNIHEGLRSKLADLYENDCIFDKFEASFDGKGRHIMTGSYKNMFHIFDTQGKTHTSIEASRSFITAKKKSRRLPRRKNNNINEEFEPEDLSKKCLHLSWLPNEQTIAIAAVNSLYIFSANN